MQVYWLCVIGAVCFSSDCGVRHVLALKNWLPVETVGVEHGSAVTAEGLNIVALPDSHWLPSCVCVCLPNIPAYNGEDGEEYLPSRRAKYSWELEATIIRSVVLGRLVQAMRIRDGPL